MDRLKLALPFVLAMTIVVAASNYLVQFPFTHFGLGEILTWGAFTYPAAFLVNDLANRRYGPSLARWVVVAGFVLAVILSIWLATPRIAVASGVAFLTAQMLDTSVFNFLRQRTWWQAPLLSTILGSILDTLLFFGIAFSAPFAFLDAATGMPDGSLAFAVPFFGGEAPLWVSLAIGDFAVKIACGLAMLAPYGAIVAMMFPKAAAAR